MELFNVLTTCYFIDYVYSAINKYRILTEFKVFMYWKDTPRANRDAEPRRRYDSYGRVFPVHEHRKMRLVSDLHNEESNLEVKSFKFDAMQ